MEAVSEIADLQITEEKTLADLVNGQNGLVIVFIPDTLGLSSRLQLKDLRNNFHKIKGDGWNLVAVTSESPEQTNDSSDDLSLAFPIYHDKNNAISKAFNTLGKSFDNPYISKRTKRRTYVLDRNLTILHLIDDIHPVSHTEDILSVLKPDRVQVSTSDYSDPEGLTSD